jgi:hypothetical protein
LNLWMRTARSDISITLLMDGGSVSRITEPVIPIILI